MISKRLDAPVADGQGVALAYYSPETQTWVSVDTTVSEDGHVLSAVVDHFSVWDDIYFGLGDLFNKRVDKPTCDGAVPRWVDDVQFLDDKNAPLLWCAGRDPKRSDVLVVKVAVNRAYGFGIRPAVKPEWAYSTLSADAGVEDLFTAGITQVLEPIDALSRLLGEAVFAAPGSEVHFGFTESQIRSLNGNPAVVVGDPDITFMVAGGLYNLLSEVAGAGNEGVAALFSLAATVQCAQALAGAAGLASKAKELAGCLIDNAEDVKNLVIDVGVRFKNLDEVKLGRFAGLLQKALYEAYAFKLGSQIGEALSDMQFVAEARKISVFTKSLTLLPSQLRASTDHLGSGAIGATAPRFAEALHRKLAPAKDSGNDACWQREMVGLPGVRLMTLDSEDAAVVRVDIENPDIRTTGKVGIGSTEEQVKRAYPAVEVQPHPYEQQGHYLIAHAGADDLLFETNDQGRVTSYRFGVKDPVSWIEGCL